MFRKHSISEIHRQFETGNLDPVDVAKTCIESVSRFNPVFHAWVCFDSEKLIRDALNVREALRRKTPLRALEGVPVGIKDVFNTLDFPTQMGSEIWRGFTPGNDARVVFYIKNAGGLVAGKTVTAEFAVHALNETINPHNINLSPGTSSSGSAVAVAAGMVPVALGTQTGGSIIRPASFCGVYGFKPSFGLLPRTGSLKTTDSLDSVGFFVSQASDMRRILDILRVHGPNFPLSYRALKDLTRQQKQANRPWRVALVKTHTWPYAPQYAKESLLSFARSLAAQEDVNLLEVMLPKAMEYAHELHSTIYEKSLSYYFKDEYECKDRMSLVMQEMIARGEEITVEEYHTALTTQNQLINEMDEFFHGFDALVCLSTAGAAPLRGLPESPDSSLMWTLTHLPAISAPVFTSPKGEPFGLQIVSRKYNDHLLINFIDYLREKMILPEGPNPHIGDRGE